MLRRIAIALLLVASAASAQQLRLYLKDGSHHLVREYSVIEDRVRYYSTERRDWEEIPLELIDLRRTEAEIKSNLAEERKEAAIADAEEKFERAQKEEIARVPVDPGVYRANGDKMDALTRAELRVENSKKRTVLRVLVPIPLIPGKSIVEIEGLKAAYSVPGPRPQFYFRLGQQDRFALVKLTPGKDARLVETLTIEPVTSIVHSERIEIETFRHEVAPGLYKVWPVKDVEPGEYAWIEYTEGEAKTQAWDFTVTGAASNPSSAPPAGPRPAAPPASRNRKSGK